MAYDFDDLYPGRFLKSGELLKTGDRTLTIKDVLRERLEGRKGPETKGILVFQEIEQQLTLNRTNGLCVKAMFGRDTGQWIGKRVTLYCAEVRTEFSETGVRLRGSPDIAEKLTFTLELARKKPRQMTLYKTDPNSRGPAKHASNTPSLYERMSIACHEYGHEQPAVNGLIKAATKKTNAKELVEEDIGVLVAYLEAQKAPALDGVPAEDGAL